MVTKTNNPQVGVIACPFHDRQMTVQARVMSSEKKKGKLYISCQSCGLIMPTLPNFQKYIKNNAEFFRDIQSSGLDASEREQQQTSVNAEQKEEQQKPKEPAKEEKPEDEEAELESKQKISDYELEMGWEQ